MELRLEKFSQSSNFIKFRT